MLLIKRIDTITVTILFKKRLVVVKNPKILLTGSFLDFATNQPDLIIKPK